MPSRFIPLNVDIRTHFRYEGFLRFYQERPKTPLDIYKGCLLSGMGSVQFKLGDILIKKRSSFFPCKTSEINS